MDQMAGRNLENVSDANLQARLEQIDKNILYIDSGSTSRDSLPAYHGWLSPWWWLRARHWTLLEFERRQLAPKSSPEIPAMPTLARGFNGTVAGGQKLLVRLSKRTWLLDLLGGRIRFAPAALYRDISVDAARSDEEMSKAHRRPGQSIQITDLQGNTTKPIGDVVFASRRSVERNGVLDDVPYWFCSFSSDLDPRLFHEFTGSDACTRARERQAPAGGIQSSRGGGLFFEVSLRVTGAEKMAIGRVAGVPPSRLISRTLRPDFFVEA